MQLALPIAEVAAPRVPIVRGRNAGGALYESATTGRRAQRWSAPTTSPNSNLGTLLTLRDRSRAAIRNNGYAKGAIDELVSNIVGTGIPPLSKADDPDFRKAVQKLWLHWTDEADADGNLEYYGLQTQAVRTWLEAGEAFIRLRPRLPADGLSVPLQIQVLEPELCPHDYNVPFMANGNKIRAGIEFNAIGKRVAYWFYHQRPGASEDFDPTDLRRIPAEAVIHLYNPVRPGQLRGVPLLTQALLRLHEVDKYDDATLLRQQLANMFVGFLKRPAQSSDEAVNPFTGQALSSTDEPPAISFEPGIFQELNPGEEVEFSDPPDVSPNYPDFIRTHLAAAAAGTGVPYEVFSGDFSKVNDRTLRVILDRFRRLVRTWQHQVVSFQMCQRTWSAWMYRAFLSGALALPASFLTNREPWERVEWMPEGWAYINPVQDVEADKAAIRAGLKSRSAVIAGRGDNAEAVDLEQAADNARAEELGLVHDSNARHTSGAGVTQARPAGSEVPDPTSEETT